MTPLLAHASHWLVDLLYAVPVLVLLIAGLVAAIRQRGATPEPSQGSRRTSS